jgi:peptidoglycan-associated lipoprotein
MNPTRLRSTLLVTAAILALVSTGCARRPALTQAAAPPPTAPVAPAPAPAPAPPPVAAAPPPPAPAPAPPPVAAAPPPPAPAPAAPPAPAPDPKLGDIHFDFDKAVLRPDAVKVLEASADWLKSNGGRAVTIEGHCDERGTEAYNLALGERRAKAAMDFLVSRGVGANRISTISYGEQRPQCQDKNEACWSRNRRAHFEVKPQ